MKNIFLFGSSGHARVIAEIIEQEGLYKIIGLLDTNQPTGTKCFGYEILGSDDELPQLISVMLIKSGLSVSVN